MKLQQENITFNLPWVPEAILAQIGTFAQGTFNPSFHMKAHDRRIAGITEA